jgi:hypothetical protein
MKNLYLLLLLSIRSLFCDAQITTAVLKANFGVDGELRCNFFNQLVQSGNDDWFKLPATTGTGQFVIDTSGAAALLAGYASNPDNRKLPFYRSMRFPNYSVINNRLLIDAYFVRDYHGDDSTMFASGSNKNGMSPADWSCPVSQSIPDKNEILDIMLHVRRAGPNVTDSMWLMGGISIENTTGSRYFDFEMYQTDIYYNRATRSFYNYGPDAGHTRWQFDAAGNMTKPGDIILTAEYSSSNLSFIEARIWIDSSSMLLNPVGFNWSGSFDGAGNGSQYGYAGIQPETAGAFYTGLQSIAGTWPGPFNLVLGDNSIQTSYTARQFMEFSVNLSKLGLDNASIFGGDDCLMPFRRVMVKTRASTSFTAALKDFVAPFDFFMAPMAELETETPMICDTGSISTIYILNPIPTSIYQWSTPNGRILGPTNGTSIVVDTPGIYIVRQFLQAACAQYATDTIVVGSFGLCDVLTNTSFTTSSKYANRAVTLNWKVGSNEMVDQFFVQRSYDGVHFETIQTVDGLPGIPGEKEYSYVDPLHEPLVSKLYYRIRLKQVNGNTLTGKTMMHQLNQNNAGSVLIYPNPVKNKLSIQIPNSKTGEDISVIILDNLGRAVLSVNRRTNNSPAIIEVDIPDTVQPGYYIVKLQQEGKITTQTILVTR